MSLEGAIPISFSFSVSLKGYSSIGISTITIYYLTRVYLMSLVTLQKKANVVFVGRLKVFKVNPSWLDFKSTND